MKKRVIPKSNFLQHVMITRLKTNGSYSIAEDFRSDGSSEETRYYI